MTIKQMDQVGNAILSCLVKTRRGDAICRACPYYKKECCKKELWEDFHKFFSFAKNILLTVNTFVNREE